MRTRDFFVSLVTTLALALMASACDIDDESGGRDDLAADVVGGDGDEDISTDTRLCAGVDCFANAACDPATGHCVCDEGFEDWTDGVGCAEETLTITGSYADDWGGHHEVTAQVWRQSGFGAASHFFISRFSNAERHVIAQNGPDNEWSPGLWSRFDWTWFDDGAGPTLFYCQTVFDAATEGEALEVAPADPADPTTGGCGGFAWTALSAAAPELMLSGSYADGWGGHHEVTGALWTQGGFGNPSFFHVTRFSNAENYVIAQNNVHNSWNSGLFSRFDWTWFDDGTGPRLYYCQTGYDAANEEDALTLAPADPTDPTAGGCGIGAWSALEPHDSVLILIGDWLDDFGINHIIDEETWVQSIDGSPGSTYTFELSRFSLAEQWLTAQEVSDDSKDGGAWSRFDWTWFDEGDGLELWYCRSVHDAATEEDALAAPRADEENPSNGGCGTSPWTKLTPNAEL